MVPAFIPPKPLSSIDSKTFLTRYQLADSLEGCGIPISYEMLNAKAKNGDGPPFRMFGKSPVYQWADAVAWVLETMGEPARTTQEHRARKIGASTPKITQIA